jgi:cold shock CspA family protein/ribosome-associated translation inhibitor RaiA
MEQQPKIMARNFRISRDVETAIRRQVAKLERFFPRIEACKVLVEAEHRFPAGEVAAYTARIDLTVPNGPLPTTRQRHPELRTAIQRAFEAARRQLEDYARIQRGAVGIAERAPQGRIRDLYRWEGYGFLETADGRAVYFHRNSVRDHAFDRLDVGSEVRFVEEPGENGPQATTVALASPGRRRRKLLPER